MAPRSIAAQPRAPISTPVTAAPDMTGSVPDRAALSQMPQSRDATPQPPQATAPRDVAREPAPDALPPAIGGKTLIAAATAGEPGASYEIAARYAEGRNVPQDLAMAAAWFDRAARGGLVPAQFRLGSMYEKGLGLKKDLQEARRLYLGAADRGHAKAMHNLAVLYAEGLDGTPDYPAAAQWFRKAAAYGVVDSQYNLAILYARGVGVERNMAESYKWFALAAKGGDKDAGKKRDDIASRLDPLQLEGARQAVEAFVPEHQPEEASATKAPSGGWDQVAATAPAKPKAVR
jgi:localization factor PodJL